MSLYAEVANWRNMDGARVVGGAKMNPTNHTFMLTTTNRNHPYFVTCEVTRVVLVGTQNCFEVVAIQRQQPGEYHTACKYAAYYRTNDLLLLKLTYESEKGSEFAFRKGEERPVVDEALKCIPFGMPVFSNLSNLTVKANLGYMIDEEVIATNGSPEVTTRMRLHFPPPYDVDRVILQEWEPGLPWWRRWKDIRDGNDTPQNALSFDATNCTVSAETFTDYLMFLPPGDNSRYVPLRKFNWDWSIIDSRSNTNIDWQIVTGSAQQHVSAATETTEHPLWTDNANYYLLWIPDNP